MSLLNLSLAIVAFDDVPSYSNPRRRRPDWQRLMQGIPVERPGITPVTIPPLSTVEVFSGVRTLTANALTDYDLANVPSVSTSRYRLTWGGAGTTPGFRTARAVASSGGNLVLTLNANSTVTATSSLGAIFGAVAAGDTVFVPGAATGDSGPFDPLNVGYWTVLAAAAAQLTLGRSAGTVFEGATETVAITDDAEFQVFSAAGVQVGDTVDISAGFALSAQAAYEVVAVTATRLEFESAAPLADETAVPGTAGLVVYSAAKRFVHVESDQPLAVRYNGDTTDNNRLDPWIPADDSLIGYDSKVGTVYSLALKNRSTQTANVTFISVE